MKSAEKILKSKQWLKDEIDKNFPQTESDWIWEDAHRRLVSYQSQFAEIPAGERMHADKYIFPAAAVYLSLKEAAGEEAAFEIMTKASDRHSRRMIDMMKKIMLLPCVRDLFIKAWDPVSRKMFGPENGFSNRFYDNPEGEYRMDVTACPYDKYCTLIGCPEMTKMFCANDDKMYGNLPGIEFLRTQTIGRGGECCDFYIRKEVKADYKNWVPEKMIAGLAAATAAAAGLNIAVWKKHRIHNRKADIALKAGLGIGFAFCARMTGWSVMAHRAFSYNGKRKLSKEIIDGTAECVTIPEGGVGLDVGCGSGALTIACAKRNPGARMVGIDRWGADFAYNKRMCEKNAKAEDVKNVEFREGNAVKLAFADGTFDAVTSNYVYHNITGVNKQQLLRESLRVLKKGGTFAIHDIMTKSKYGDMDKFVEELRAEGYEEVNLIPTDRGMFMLNSEAAWMMLKDSVLLVGRK